MKFTQYPNANKYFGLLGLLCASALIIVACKDQHPEAQPKSDTMYTDNITEQEALDLLERWTDAYLEGDAGPLEDILDDRWVYSGSADGSTGGKLATISDFKAADYTFGEITYSDLSVETFNDIAVLRGAERMSIISADGADTTWLNLRFTDVYQKKAGKVRAISTHSSPIESAE